MVEIDKQNLYLLLGVLESKIKPKIIIPAENETAAISEKPMTAALFYDRVWCPTIDVWQYPGKMPDEIRFFGATNEERLISFQGLVEMEKGDVDIGEYKFHTLDKLRKSRKEVIQKSTLSFLADIQKAKTKESFQDVLKKASQVSIEDKEQYVHNTNIVSGCIYKDIAIAFSRKYKREIITIYPTKEINNTVYQEGDRDIILSSMENLKLVDEKTLTWEQVLEFRHDSESKLKYKRFLHWLDKDMIGKSQSFIEDEIAIKLNDYENALKKHGIKTILGTLEEIISGDFFKNSLLASGLVALTTDPVLGIVAEASLLVYNVAIKLAKKKIDYEEVATGPNSEISWVYEVNSV